MLIPEHNQLNIQALKKLMTEGLVWKADSTSNLHSFNRKSLAVPFSLNAIDSQLPHAGLVCGAIHEFFPLVSELSLHSIPALLAGNALKNFTSPYYVIWIGRTCWPTPFLIQQCLPKNSWPFCIFIDPPEQKSLLWSVETALKTPGIAAVIADCSSIKKFSFPLSRRLALSAAKAHALGILIRNPKHIHTSSAAATRWLAQVIPSPSKHQRWKIELLRSKGRQAYIKQWVLEFNTDTINATHAEANNSEKAISLHLLSEVGQESAASITKKSAA